MVSQTYYGALMFLIATTNIVFALDDKMIEPSCNPITSQSIAMLTNSINSSIDQISKASPHFAPNGILEKLIIRHMPNDRLALSALASCQQYLSLAMYHLNHSLFSSQVASDKSLGDANTWTCASSAYLNLCIEGFEDTVYEVRDSVFKRLKSSMDETSISSAIVSELVSRSCHSNSDHKLLFEDEKLVQPSADITANLVVAQDGTGNYSTISDAIKAVPNNSESRFFIYVKKGVYFENVKIDENKWNVMMFGDGMNDTIVSANRSYVDGFDLFSTATFAVLGKGFIALDMGFSNTAGPIKQQAVALLSTSDQSVFYRCRMDGYQDTLFATSNRQLYRECHILGTIDFIFGDSAMVVQNSTILAKRPLPGQSNAITANARMDPQCKTGISIQSCDIVPAEDLTGVDTYLGRVWKSHSTIVFMQNNMNVSINPKGWAQMAGMTGTSPPPTIFFAEYDNRGPGANVTDRVKWNGVRPNLTRDEADMYTVHSLINGDEWLPTTNVSFSSGLNDSAYIHEYTMNNFSIIT